jgi:predicted DNA binding CopG/RHH family protein
MRKGKPMKKTETKKRHVPQSRAQSTDHLDLSRMQPVAFPNLKPSTTTISLRLPDAMLNKIKVMANKKDVPYQSLIKMFLADKIRQN